jgi:ATF/CREB family transcription factor
MAGNFASSLPMPSPNTAAFLNMVTNSTPLEGAAGENGQPQAPPPADGQPPHPPTAIPPHMQQHHGLAHLQPQQHGGDLGQETITPGTLSALTGVFNDMNRGVPPHAPHPPQFFQPGMPHPPPGMPPHAHSHQGPPHADYAQQSANAASQAANGLFLLSQAHQELSKREEEGRVTTPLMGKRAVSNLPPNARPGPPQPAPSTTGTKRKSDAGQTKGGKKGKKNTPESKLESASPNFDSDDDGDGDKRSNNGKPETEEDKRKNFLERNRQGEHQHQRGQDEKC